MTQITESSCHVDYIELTTPRPGVQDDVLCSYFVNTNCFLFVVFVKAGPDCFVEQPSLHRKVRVVAP